MKTTSLRAYAAVGLLAAAPAALAITGSIGESNWTGSEATSNPYDVSNMKCEWYDGEGGVFEGEVLYADGTNPYYPKGLCTAPTINLSARTPYTCEASGGSDGCARVRRT